MTAPRLTRRDFLRASAAGTLAALLAGCTPLPPLAPPSLNPAAGRVRQAADPSHHPPSRHPQPSAQAAVR